MMMPLISVFMMLLISNPSHASDFGKSGQTWEIKEEAFEKMIMRRLSKRNLAEDHKIVEEKVKKKVMNPARVNGILETIKANSYLYDPTYIVPENITDDKGNILYTKGTRVNYLEHENLDKQLVFLDGESQKQLKWFKRWIEEGKIKEHDTVILIGGSPIYLEEKFRRIFYFDQFGEITTKLKIQHVPAVVFQEGKALRIEEVIPDEAQF